MIFKEVIETIWVWKWLIVFLIIAVSMPFVYRAEIEHMKEICSKCECYGGEPWLNQSNNTNWNYEVNT